MVRLVAISIVLAACGAPAIVDTPPAAKRKPLPAIETEPEREAERRTAAHELVPPNTNCLPPALAKRKAPRLELAAVGTDPVVCAFDGVPDRLLGPVACWKIDLATGALTYREPAPLPGAGFSVWLDDRCARGFCIPQASELPEPAIARISYNFDGSRIAVLAGDEVHLFDTKTRARTGGFSIKGDAVTIHFVGDAIFVALAGEKKTRAATVAGFKLDGTPLDAFANPDGTPLSVAMGSFVVLEKNRIAIAEQGFSSVTVHDIQSGTRTKVSRVIPKPPCTSDELAAYWEAGDEIGDKCQAHMDKTFAHLVGATGFAGTKSWVILARGPRLGQLVVMDPATLAEKAAIKLAWCTDAGEDREQDDE